jgi:hypothetical protein
LIGHTRRKALHQARKKSNWRAPTRPRSGRRRNSRRSTPRSGKKVWMRKQKNVVPEFTGEGKKRKQPWPRSISAMSRIGSNSQRWIRRPKRAKSRTPRSSPESTPVSGLSTCALAALRSAERSLG